MKANDIVLLTGTANIKLADHVAKLLGKELFNPVSYFSDGEIRIKVPENVRRRHVIIIQPTSAPVNNHVMELVLMLDAAKRSSATEVTAVIPYFGYSRQDRKEMPRVPISSSVVANMIINNGADRILTLDIHSEQQQGFIKLPWDNLFGSYALVPELKKRNLQDLVVASPDKGGMRQATKYAQLLGAMGIALVYKERDVNINNKSKTLAMIGDVKGKNVLIVDDIIDTGGTLVNAANYLKEQGAKTITAVSTHGLFSGDALDKIDKSSIDELIVTDSVVQKKVQMKNTRVKTVSVAPLLGEAIKRIESGESISRDLILDNPPER